MVAACGIQVIPFVGGDMREVIGAWLSGGFDWNAFAMPGCRIGRRFGEVHAFYQGGNTMRGKGRSGMGTGGGQGKEQGGKGRGSGARMPGYSNPASRPGFKMGFGRGSGAWRAGCGGRGRRNMFYATGLPGWMRSGAYLAFHGYPTAPDPEMERQALKNQAETLQSELDHVRKRLAEMESGPLRNK